MSSPLPAQPIFYYDLGSPECYVAAERIMTLLPVVPEWEPVLGRELGGDALALEDRERLGGEGRERLERLGGEPPDRESIERLAADLGLQQLRWPSSWPPDTQLAMLAATYAKRVGRAVAFSLAAFRQAFAAGRDLGDENTVLLAAAACEMHPAAVLKGVQLRSVRDALDAATRRARLAGVSALPAVQLEDRVIHGEAGLEEAAMALGEMRP